MLIDPPGDRVAKHWTDVPPRSRKSRPLNETLSAKELRAIRFPAACEAVVLSYKEELKQAHSEVGAWELRAVSAEQKLAAALVEISRLTHDLEGVRKVNRKLHEAIYRGPARV
jgi:hypothetical protein